MTRSTLFAALCLGGALLMPGSGALNAQPQLMLKVATTRGAASPLLPQLAAFERHVEQVSAGRIQVKRFAGGALGDDATLLERTRAGSIQAYAGSLDALSAVLPAADVLGAPYLFSNARRADAVLDGPARRTLAAQLLERGLRFAMWGPSDFRVWFSRDKPLRRPADAAGLRAPAPRSGAQAALLSELGMLSGREPLRPALAPLGDPPDAFDATLLDAAAAAFDRAARHVTLSRHALDSVVVVYSARWFDGLPEDLQSALDEIPGELAKQARRAQREAEPRMLERLGRLGIEVHAHDGGQRRAFVRATRGAFERLRRELGPEARALLSSAR